MSLSSEKPVAKFASTFNWYRYSEGSPNVLIWVLDDTGFAQTTPYGAAGIRTPTMQRLADRGTPALSAAATAAATALLR